jgi:hypothetical protein
MIHYKIKKIQNQGFWIFFICRLLQRVMILVKVPHLQHESLH